MITEEAAKKLIREIPDFPTPGILFRDITPILQDARAFREVVFTLAESARPLTPDVIVGVESRGFVFGAPVALELGVGFVPVRKEGKLPREKASAEYSLEYGKSVIEIHRDAIQPGSRAVIVDDLLATGGTAAAAARLVEQLGGTVAGFSFLIELTDLKGRESLQGYHVFTLVRY